MLKKSDMNKTGARTELWEVVSIWKPHPNHNIFLPKFLQALVGLRKLNTFPLFPSSALSLSIPCFWSLLRSFLRRVKFGKSYNISAYPKNPEENICVVCRWSVFSPLIVIKEDSHIMINKVDLTPQISLSRIPLLFALLVWPPTPTDRQYSHWF